MRPTIFAMAFVILQSANFAVAVTDEPGPDDDATPAEIFQQRIMPIFRSPDPSSCVQCHLASVDLKNYILPSHEKTFVSLRDQGLIELDEPGKSKILKLIKMGDADPDEGARMIHEDMRAAEYKAFADWIEACTKDERLRNLPALSEEEFARPDKPDEVIRHARKSRVIDSFVRNVWSQRMRCFPCHTPHEIRPKQKAAQKKYAEYRNEYGERMNIFRQSPAETIRYLVDDSRDIEDGRLPLLNLREPARSLIVLKPTAKLPRKVNDEFLPPSYSDPVSHMGGLKMHLDDQSYKSFVAWIKDYANVAADRYIDADDLPADNWYATRRVLRMKDAPEDWPMGTPVQLFVYSMADGQSPDAGQISWSSSPVAFTQGTITPRRIVNGALFRLAPQNREKPKWNRENSALPKGRYLIKVYVDTERRLATDPTLMLDEDDFRGQIEIKNALWRMGFPKAENVSAKDLQINRDVSH